MKHEEKIQAAEQRLRDALASGADTSTLREELRRLRAKPSVSNDGQVAARARIEAIRASAADIAAAVRARVAKIVEQHSLELKD